MEELGPLQGQREATPEDKRNTKAQLAEVLKKKRESKVRHGQNVRNTERQLISEENTFL